MNVDVKKYQSTLKYIFDRISETQAKIAEALTNELMHLYWDIGKAIIEKQLAEGWKSEIIAKLCADIKRKFPDSKGFSRTNIFRMRAFYQAYQELALDEIDSLYFMSSLRVYGHCPSFQPKNLSSLLVKFLENLNHYTILAICMSFFVLYLAFLSNFQEPQLDSRQFSWLFDFSLWSIA